jgi:putative ubiquitin-RnfH superfamily antitoxin RatB of RatAB toxin-antitoxin module
MAEPEAQTLSVCVVYSPQARTVLECPLNLPPGATVLEALERCSMGEVLAAVKSHPEWLGVWGRKANPVQALRDGDRVEVYRPLRVDPKAARRERFQKQGARTAGLFAKRRSNAKSGY